MSNSFRQLPRILFMLLPLVLATLVAAGEIKLEFLNRLESFIYDVRLRMFMPRKLDERIVIIDLDEQSLGEVGRWPWSRNEMARLVNRLFDEQKVLALGVDVVFAEPDDSSGLSKLRSLASNELRGETGFRQQLARLSPSLDYDGLFADALRGKPIVLGYYFTNDNDGQRFGTLPAPVFDDGVLEQRRFHVTEWTGYGANIDRIARAAPKAGFFNPIVDSDGIVRSLPLLAKYQGRYYESLALGVFRKLLGDPELEPAFPDTGDYEHLERIRVKAVDGPVDIFVDRQVAAWVPFRGNGGPDGGSYTYISAADVLQGRLPPGMLEGKVAFLGTTAPGLLDLRATPVGKIYPGVEAHANLLSGLLDGHLPVEPDYAAGYDVVQILVIGLLLLMVLPRLGALMSGFFSLGVISALVGLNLWLYAANDLILPMATALLMLFSTVAINMSYGYFVEGRSKRSLAHLFGAYVPPELVHEMVKDPGRYSMQAVEKELTVMFSDMRGFTKLSETMLPTQLQQLLNEVFNRLSHEISVYSGTIDKYMGDCVMAFWGAPLETDKHARLAVEAALAMRKAVFALNVEIQNKGLPAIGMGVGLNTGPMCVGDMGSRQRRSYTVIGDAVNLGSRLEGLSKFYGVEIVASGRTREQAGEAFIWQQLDLVKVKGKNEAVPIHTVWDTRTALSADWADELTQWDDFLALWRGQQWPEALPAIQALCRKHPDKVLYQLYEERVSLRLGQAFDPGWDGSTQFETK